MDLPLLIQLAFGALCLALLTLRALPFLHPHLLHYGKNQSPTEVQRSARLVPSWTLQLLNLTMPKRRFRDFYILAAAFSATMILALGIAYAHGTVLPPISAVPALAARMAPRSQNLLDAIIPLILFQAQVTRRCYEVLYVERPSLKARIHAGHYLLGIIHYTLSAYAVWLDHASLFGLWSAVDRGHVSLYDISPHHIVGASLFAWAWLHQWNLHVILADLRPTSATTSSSPESAAPTIYRIPRGDWFEYVSSPHYLAENLMYAALFIASGYSPTLLAITVWTLCNLYTTATLTHRWYQGKFDDYPPSRRALIPYLL